MADANLDPGAGRPSITDEQVKALGKSIRDRRKALGLTLVQVAERSGLSATFISQVERGRYRPSVPSLNRLAGAMDTQAYFLMIPASTSATRVEINRAADRARYAQEDNEGSGLSMPLIKAGNQLRAVEVAGAPLDWQGPFVHRNDEFMYVISGTIEADLDGKVHQLAAGDSLLFSGGVELRWRAGTSDTRVIVVIVDDSLNG